MVERVQLFQRLPQFLQDGACVIVALKFLHQLPGDVHRRVARHHIAQVALPLLRFGNSRVS
jgi:hypothetical protein